MASLAASQASKRLLHQATCGRNARVRAMTAHPIVYRTRSSNSGPARKIDNHDDDDDHHHHWSMSTGGRLTETATSYFNNLRLRAASALTASLTPNERASLLQSINAVDEKSAVEHARRSIGEAVAEAVAKEAERNEYVWKREREALIAKAERAAMERVNHDLLIQQRRLELEQWQMKVRAERKKEEEENENEKKKKEEEEEEKRNQQAEKESKHVDGGASSTEDTTKMSIMDRRDIVVVDDHDHENHPILGPPLIDLGYKRVHVTSARALAAIPIWEKQRAYRHDRAKNMASDKMRTTDLGLPGIISLHEAEDGQLAILDGQHRVGMMAILQSKGLGGEVLDLDRVLVEVFPQQSRSSAASSHAADLFTEINKAEPVKLVDMPGVAKKADRTIINDAATMMMNYHPEMFKSSQRCRSPHMNVDNLRDAVFAADILKRHSIKSSKALYDWMSEKNQELKHRYTSGENGNTATNQVSQAALNKAIKFDFFLGLDSSWLYS